MIDHAEPTKDSFCFIWFLKIMHRVKAFLCLRHKNMMHINRIQNYKNQSRNAKIEVETLKSKSKKKFIKSEVEIFKSKSKY